MYSDAEITELESVPKNIQSSIIEEISTPFLVIDRSLKVYFANTAGRSLHTFMPISIENEKLQLESPDFDSICRIFSLNNQKSYFYIKAFDTHQKLVIVTKLMQESNDALYLLTFDIIQLHPNTDFHLSSLFSLTPTQGKLGNLLVQGYSLNEAALGMGISIATVKTHLRDIFSKMGVNRQADLIRLLSFIMTFSSI